MPCRRKVIDGVESHSHAVRELTKAEAAKKVSEMDPYMLLDLVVSACFWRAASLLG